MSKRPSLFAPKPTPVASAEETPEPAAPVPADAARLATARPPSRAGKRVLSVYLDPLAWKQLRQLALDAETSTQALGEEAINLLFENSDRIVSALTQPQPHVDVSAPVAPAPKTINHNPTFGGKLVRPRSDARRSTNHVDGGDRETDG